MARYSPTEKAKDFKGQRKKGNDNNFWISTQDKTGRFAWRREGVIDFQSISNGVHKIHYTSGKIRKFRLRKHS